MEAPKGVEPLNICFAGSALATRAGSHGPSDRTRTCDLAFRKRLHYPLCYVGMAEHEGLEPPVPFSTVG